MYKTDKVKNVVYRFFLYLFMFQVSISVLPAGLVQSYGFFGELSAVVVEENQRSGILDKQVKAKLNTAKKSVVNYNVKRTQFLWLLTLIVNISNCYLIYLLKFLYYKTPVIMKVRMNN